MCINKSSRTEKVLSDSNSLINELSKEVEKLKKLLLIKIDQIQEGCDKDKFKKACMRIDDYKTVFNSSTGSLDYGSLGELAMQTNDIDILVGKLKFVDERGVKEWSKSIRIKIMDVNGIIYSIQTIATQ